MAIELSQLLTLESLMTRSLHLACGALEPSEREVVCGDLTEAGECGWPALRQVLSLVIRRRVLSLQTARSGVPAAVLTILATVLLTLTAVRIADGNAIYLWMWINNSDWAILQNAGFWLTVRDLGPGLLFSQITLACCSWACGLLIGWSSEKTRWFSALLMVATIVFMSVWGLPAAIERFLVLHSARDYAVNAAAFTGIFYRRIFPGAVVFLLMMLPAWWGMRQNSTLFHFAGPARFVLLLLCVGAFGSLVCQNLIWPTIQVWGFWPLRYPHFPYIAPLTATIPIAFFFLAVTYRSGLGRAGSV